MAFREVTMFEIKEVVRQWLRGHGVKTIARSVSADPKTVRRYGRAAESLGLAQSEGLGGLDDERFLAVLEALKAPPTRPESEGRRLCEEHREFIEKKLGARVRLTKVHRLLQRQGVQVTYSMLYRFAVEELEFGKKAATLPVIDGEPGKELQLDTGQFLLPEPDESGRKRRVKAFIFTPNVSRYRFVYVAERETTEEAIHACEAAWEFYGGIFDVLLIDNTKAMVEKAGILMKIWGPLLVKIDCSPSPVTITSTSNYYLQNIDGLSGVTHASGAGIQIDPLLKDLDGLSNLTTIDDYFIIYKNGSLESLRGPSSLTEIGSTLSVVGNKVLPECEVDWLVDNIQVTGGGSVGSLVSSDNTGSALCL